MNPIGRKFRSLTWEVRQESLIVRKYTDFSFDARKVPGKFFVFAGQSVEIRAKYKEKNKVRKGERIRWVW